VTVKALPGQFFTYHEGVVSGGTTTTPSHGFGEKPAPVAGSGDAGAEVKSKSLSTTCPDGCLAAFCFLFRLFIRGSSEVGEYVHNVFTPEASVTPGSDAARPQYTAIAPSPGRVDVYVEHTGYLAGRQQIPVTFASSH